MLRRILLVDDEKLILQGLTARLAAILPDIDARQAQSADEALAILEGWQAQLVIVDIQMPDMDGLTLIAKIKERRTDIHFVILSGYAEFAYAQRGIQLGVHEFLVKPVSTQELQNTLTRIAQKINDEASDAGNVGEVLTLKRRLNSISLQQDFFRLIGGARDEQDAALMQKQVFPQARSMLRLTILYVSSAGKPPMNGGGEPERSLLGEVEALLTDSAEYDAPYQYLQIAYLNVMSALSLNAGLRSLEIGVDSSPLNSFDSREEFLQYLKMLLHSTFLPRNDIAASRVERIRHAIEYIRKHFSENLTLDGLSYQYALSPNYFSTVFKEATGMGVVSFLTGMRIENACYMLVNTELSVSSIAHRVGYSDAQYFYQVFKKSVGSTPMQYRKLHTNQGEPM